jgi:hypothetical protein
MEQTYNIKTLQPAPSMSQDETVFVAGSYAEAVQVAHEAFRRTGRATVLGLGAHGMYWYHRIDGKGVAVDRNLNSGVPEVQHLPR